MAFLLGGCGAQIYAVVFLAVPCIFASFAVLVSMCTYTGLNFDEDDAARAYNGSAEAERHVGHCSDASHIGPKAWRGKSYSLAGDENTLWPFTNKSLLAMFSTGTFYTFVTCMLTLTGLFTGAGMELQIGFWFLNYAGEEVSRSSVCYLKTVVMYTAPPSTPTPPVVAARALSHFVYSI